MPKRQEAVTHYDRAVALQGDGQYAEAIAAYERALQVDPTFFDAAFGLARCYAMQEAWTWAVDAYRRALDIDPAHVEAATGRAEALRRAGCLHLALAGYDRALALRPDQLYALAGKGETLRMLGRYEEATRWFEAALGRQPDHLSALLGLGSALNALGRYSEARPLWERALALDSEAPRAIRGLREATQRPDHEGPVPRLTPLTGDRLTAEMDFTWGRALARDGRYAEAVRALGRACRRMPDWIECAAQLARVHEQAANWDAAAQSWAEVRRIAPDRLDAWSQLGDALRKAGRIDEALKAYSGALERDPTYVYALAGRAEVLRLQGREDLALEGFGAALEQQPAYAFALRGRAATLNALGRYAEARPLWQRALSLEPDSAFAQEGLALCVEALSEENPIGASPPTHEAGQATDPVVPDDPAPSASLITWEEELPATADTAAFAEARASTEAGHALLVQGRLQEAIAALRRATEQAADWVLPWHLLGLAHFHDGQFHRAAAAYEEVLRREPHHLDAAIGRADSLRKYPHFQAAMEAYEAILEERPDEPRAAAGKGECLRMLGRFDEALLWFDRALGLRPDHLPSLCGKAAVLNALHRFDEALPLWRRASLLNRRSEFIRRGLDHALSALDPEASRRIPGARPRTILRRRTGMYRPRTEERAPEEPTEEDPMRPDRERKLLLGQTTGLSHARPDRARAVEELERGRAFYKERNYQAAARAFTRALTADPSYPEAALRLGMAYEDDRQYKRAIEAYERCLQLDPQHYQAATNIGEALRKGEQYEDAIRAYDRALEMQPDYLYALAGRAECMRMLGDYEGCLSWFDRALEVGARHAFAVQGKAAALNALQRFDEALPLWEKALEIEPSSPFAREGKAACEAALRRVESEPEEEPESTTPTLDEQGRDLTALALDGKLPPIVGREKEIRAVMKTLVRRLKANPLLLGDPGVGKTAVVEGVAQLLTTDEAPERLRSLRIIELSMGSLVAGTKYRGTFEERLKEIIREAREGDNIVLFIDEIHTLVGAGRTEGGSLDAANILKPALARGEITVIGATTLAEFRKHFEADSALERRFQPIHVEEPSEDATVRLLNEVKHVYEAHHDVHVTAEAVRACVRLGVRFIPDRRLPDKALDLLDEACADASLSDVDRVTAEVVAQVVSERTGIPVHELTSEERERLNEVERFLSQRVIGQDEAIQELAGAVRLARSGLRDPNRPRGVFLFVGTSGVGKTELARALSDFLFPEGNALIKLDMSEFSDKFTGSRLLGAPPGYAGHGDEGQLTGPLRQRPYAVVLLDEFEKAHGDVQAMFLSLFDEGVVTDSEGRKVQAREAFFILTTNAGTEASQRTRVGFGGDTEQAIRDAALDRIRSHFRPELLNRIDDIVIFRPLDDNDLQRIVTLNLERLRERAAEVGVTLTWDPALVQLCARHNPDPAWGARPALRAIDELVAEPLGKHMLQGSSKKRRSFRAIVRDGEVHFEEQTPAGEQGTPSPTQERV